MKACEIRDIHRIGAQPDSHFRKIFETKEPQQNPGTFLYAYLLTFLTIVKS